jgi:TetR/AcrR family transcriptional regulator, tetracycline repressor protein
MTAPSKRGRPGPRRALTEDEILDATLQLLDEGGANGASVRGIAAKVGVAPNAVYTYFPDKAAVIRALVERLFGEVDHGVFADRAQPWRQRVESLAVELRARLVAHPGAATLMIGQPRRPTCCSATCSARSRWTSPTSTSLARHPRPNG